jgi:small subunit ribosomal protein S20
LANIKQQKKRVHVAARQRLENLRYRSAIKTYFRRLQRGLDQGDEAVVAGEHVSLVKLIDRAASKRALHPNNAARKKARAARLVAAGPRVEAPKKRARKPAASKRGPAKKASSK